MTDTATADRPSQGGLSQWGLTGDRLDPTLRARVAAHPRLGEAAQALARNMLAAGAADKALDGIFKDAGRYGVAFVAIYLHLTGGLTLARLKKVAVQLASPGRARAVLLYLRYLGFITSGTRRPGDPECWVPTAKCLDAWGRHLKAALEAAAIIEPGAAAVAAALERPEVRASFARCHCECLIAAMEGEAEKLNLPFHRIFLHRSAGNQIFWTLLLSEEADRFPPQKTRPLVLPDIARRFGVSRTHVRRLFAATSQHDLLSLDKDDAVSFRETTRPLIIDLYSAQMMWLLFAAARTLDEFPGIGLT